MSGSEAYGLRGSSPRMILARRALLKFHLLVSRRFYMLAYLGWAV
jgi:hypothetical protein